LGECAPPGTFPFHSDVIAAGSKREIVEQFRVYLAFENFDHMPNHSTKTPTFL